MGGEDFAEYLKVVKGAYFRLGCCNEKKNTCYPQHHPKFDIDEDSLITGAKILAALALEVV
jgi:amidohydrolase